MAVRDKALIPLSAETIVAAALAIADRDGLDALSMRSLARKLQCNPMSLYEHVANKDALLDLMADRSMAALPELDPGGDWREELSRFFIAFHDLFVKHPAVAHVTVQRPLAGETALARGEPALQTLLRAGFDDAEAVELFIALANYTIGASLYELARRGPDQPLAANRFDALQAAEHPTVHRLSRKIAQASGDEQFRRALTHLMQGYEPGRA
ncbi:MAG: TetR/AcrR family transcriptional regulator [Solirubrobacteraceae bacterium]